MLLAILLQCTTRACYATAVDEQIFIGIKTLEVH